MGKSRPFLLVITTGFVALFSGPVWGGVINIYLETFESGVPGSYLANFYPIGGDGHYRYWPTTIDSGLSAQAIGGDAFALYVFPSPYIIGNTFGADEVLRTSVVVNTTGSAGVMLEYQNGFFNFGSTMGTYIKGQYQGGFDSPIPSGQTTDVMWETNGSSFFDVFTRPHGAVDWNLFASYRGVPMPTQATGIRLCHEGASSFLLDTIKLDVDTARTLPEPLPLTLLATGAAALAAYVWTINRKTIRLRGGIDER